MREFSDADRTRKKKERIRLPENPDNLAPEALAALKERVKAALKDGYLSCPTGWSIARQAGVSRIAAGAAADSLGVRVTDCQLGCFDVDKTPFDNMEEADTGGVIVPKLEALQAEGKLTCATVFDLAAQLNVTPKTLADIINARRMKVKQCQLGCF